MTVTVFDSVGDSAYAVYSLSILGGTPPQTVLYARAYLTAVPGVAPATSAANQTYLEGTLQNSYPYLVSISVNWDDGYTLNYNALQINALQASNNYLQAAHIYTVPGTYDVTVTSRHRTAATHSQSTR